MKKIMMVFGIILLLSSCATLQKWFFEAPFPVSELREGQTREEVLELYRRPNKINTTITRSTRREQWVYRINGTIYLYFENGILTSWQY